MWKQLDNGSQHSVAPEISSLFTGNLCQATIASSRYQEHGLINSTSVTPFEFKINSGKTYLDLKSSFLTVRCKIVDSKGDVVKPGGATRVAPINLAGMTLFRQCQLSIGGDLVWESGSAMHLTSYVHTLMSYDDAYKESVLSAAGFTNGDDGTDTDKGYLERCKWAENGTMEFSSSLIIPLFMQPRAIPSYTDIRLLLYPNTDKITCEQRGGAVTENYRIVFEELTLSLKHLILHDSALLSCDNLIREQNGITYPLRNLVSRVVFVSGGRRAIPEHLLFLSTVPRRLFVCQIPAANFNGSYSNSALHFDHFDISSIALETSAGDLIPLKPFNLQFTDQRSYTRPFMLMHHALGNVTSGSTNGIDMESFAKRNNIFAFDLTAANDGTSELLKMGETKLTASYSKNLPADGIYLFILGEFESSMHLSPTRSAKVDIVA